MPAVQFLDIPNIGSALGKFGGGLLDEYTGSVKQGQENDALTSILDEAKKLREEGASQEDIISLVMKKPGLSFEKKKTLSGVLNDVSKTKYDIATKNRQEKRDQERLDIQRKKIEIDSENLKNKESKSYYNDVNKYESASNTLKEMSELVKKGNMGVLSRADPRSNTISDIAEWEILSKSLIAFVMSGVSIRNQHEFLSASQKLTDPYTRDATKIGIIRSLEKRVNEEISGVKNKYGIQDGIKDTSSEAPTIEDIRAAIKRKRGG